MLTTLRGNVESDPMRVPAPAAMSTGREHSFENVLRDRVTAETRPEPEKKAVEAPAQQARPEEPKAEHKVDDEPTEVEHPHDHTDDNQDPTAATTTHIQVESADVTQTPRRGETGRQEEPAGKGTDSPRTSSCTNEPLIAAVVVHGASQTTNGPVVAAAQAGVQGVTGAKATGEAPTRGVDAAWQRANTPSRAAAVAAGYRTSSTSSAQLLDQARDSVFKQILLKLNPGGGEMRMRLEPPDLGELDLHMIVADGNKLSLSIAAERQDMTALLQRHMDELKQTLQNAGIEVTETQVRTRDEGSRNGQRNANDRQQGGADNLAGDARNQLPRLGGYVTAEGLDFWV